MRLGLSLLFLVMVIGDNCSGNRDQREQEQATNGQKDREEGEQEWKEEQAAHDDERE